MCVALMLKIRCTKYVLDSSNVLVVEDLRAGNISSLHQLAVVGNYS